MYEDRAAQTPFPMRLLPLLCLLLTAGSACVPSLYAQGTDTLLYVIRVDDIESRNTTTPRGITAFQNAVEARGGKVTWGVIPHRLIEPQHENGELAAQLRETILRGHEVSLHGFDHICDRCGQSSHEMYCTSQRLPFSYAEQAELIRRGQAIMRDLVGISTTSFIPPGHAMDLTTAQVLADSQFNVLSSTVAHAEETVPGLFNVAPNAEFSWALTPANYQTRLRQAIDAVQGKTYYLHLLHDPFTRPGYENGLVVRWMGEVLDSLNARYGDRIRYVTATEAAIILQQRATSTEDVAVPAALALNVWPNPSSGALRIEMEVPDALSWTVSVYDLTGRLRWHGMESVTAPGRYTRTPEVSNLESGMYLVQVRTSAGHHLTRVWARQ